MITYKGNPLVKGKHFIYENQTVEYQGKIYGDKHLFKLDETDLILEEQEALQLKSLQEHSLLSEQDNADDLYQVVTSYTDKQLDMIKNLPTSELWKALLNSFQEELNQFDELNLTYKTSITDINGEDYLLEVIQDFLKDTQRNISDTSLPNIYCQLNNFIYNIKKLEGSK